jgi:hypothetical protein
VLLFDEYEGLYTGRGEYPGSDDVIFQTFLELAAETASSGLWLNK